MKIDVIDTFAGFHQLRENWESLYAVAPDAHIFLSWTWMAGWLKAVKTDWLILAARASDEDGNRVDKYCAFFPLRLRTHAAPKGGATTQVVPAGTRFADYTGLICQPDMQQEAMRSFSSALQEMSWAEINLQFLRLNDSAQQYLGAAFSETGQKVAFRAAPPDGAGINNHICPSVELPNNFDDYLSSLSTNMRQKLRRLLRKLDNDDELEITQVTAETLERDVEILVNLWTRRWQMKKKRQTPAIQANLRGMFKFYFGLGILQLPVLWKAGQPIGALGNMIDWQRREVAFVIAGRDPDCPSPPSGLMLHAHSIREAISKELKRYDFLRGNERYKYSFGVTESHLTNLVVRPKKTVGGDKLLDRRSIPAAISIAKNQLRDGELGKAIIGYRQILSVDHACAPAALGFATAALGLGRVKEATRILNDLARHPKVGVGARKLLARIATTDLPSDKWKYIVLQHSGSIQGESDQRT